MIFIINNPNGKIDISGKIHLQGAKNSMLNNLCLPLLTSDECIISNVPRIGDIELNLQILEQLGAKVKWITDNSVSIKCDEITNKALDPTLSQRTTGSKFFIPVMVNRFGEYFTGPSGGCNIGDREFEKYAKSLESFGIGFDEISENYYRFYKIDIQENVINLNFPSFGLTVNAILSSVFNKKTITITNTCLEAEIDNTVEMLNAMGCNVIRVESNSIIIKGVEKCSGCNFRNMSDRNALVSYAIMGIITNSNLIIENFDNVKMEAFYKALELIGVNYVIEKNELIILPTKEPLKPIALKAFLYPEFHSDWQPLFAPLLSQIDGISQIEEKLFPDRLRYWNELGKMKANYKFDYTIITRFRDNNPHCVQIFGNSKLIGNDVIARDLRGGMALVIASLVAKGITYISNAEEIKRGYENLLPILKSLNVDITEKS